MKSLEQWFSEYGESHRHPGDRPGVGVVYDPGEPGFSGDAGTVIPELHSHLRDRSGSFSNLALGLNICTGLDRTICWPQDRREKTFIFPRLTVFAHRAAVGREASF